MYIYIGVFVSSRACSGCEAFVFLLQYVNVPNPEGLVNWQNLQKCCGFGKAMSFSANEGRNN